MASTDSWGEYQLIERLGRGGMGEVFKARHEGPAGLSRTLVIKRLLPHLASDVRFAEMFLREARLTARLTHPNIVQLLGFGEIDGQHFMAMEYVAGRQLNDVVCAVDGARPPVGLGAFVVREVCRALSYAWRLKDGDGTPLRLMHRDVSPSNIMLGFDGVVKLLDFGVAKALSSAEDSTEIGVLRGKLGYMAPERLDCKPCDHRADLFAAGVVLHETLTGRRLFEGATPHQLRRMMSDSVPPPSTFNPDVPPALDRICIKAIQYDPHDRYASGQEMAAALDEILFDLKWGSAQLSELMQALFQLDAPVPAAASSVEQWTSSDTIIDGDPPLGTSTTQPSAASQREPVAAAERTTATYDVASRSPGSAAAPALPTRAAAFARAESVVPPSEASSTIGLATDPTIPARAATLSTVRPPPRKDGASWLQPLPVQTLATTLGASAYCEPPRPTTLTRVRTHSTAGSGRSSWRRVRDVGSRLAFWGMVAAASTLGVALGSARFASDSAPATERPMANIVVESQPSGAELLLDGTPPLSGQTPFRGEVPRTAEPRKLVLRMPGYRDTELVVSPRSDLILNLILEPLPSRK